MELLQVSAAAEIVATIIVTVDRSLQSARAALVRLSAAPKPPKRPPICAVKHCPVCKNDYAPRSNRQIMCGPCREKSTHESVATIAAKDPDSTCTRCGKPSFGRYCSRSCYVDGAEPDDRRAGLLAALADRPRFACDMLRLPDVVESGNKRSTINGDLQALRKLGKVFSSPDGWRRVGVDYPAVDASEPPPVRQAVRKPVARPSQPKPVRQAVSSEIAAPTPEPTPEPARPVVADGQDRPKARIHCSRCRDLFWSLGPHHRICNDCVARDVVAVVSAVSTVDVGPLPLQADDDSDLEVVWRPSRDAPSLTDPFGHMKSSLGGAEHLIHRP